MKRAPAARGGQDAGITQPRPLYPIPIVHSVGLGRKLVMNDKIDSTFSFGSSDDNDDEMRSGFSSLASSHLLIFSISVSQQSNEKVRVLCNMYGDGK